MKQVEETQIVIGQGTTKKTKLPGFAMFIDTH